MDDLVNDLFCAAAPFVRASSKKALCAPPPPADQPRRRRVRPPRVSTDPSPVSSDPPVPPAPMPQERRSASCETPNVRNRKHEHAALPPQRRASRCEAPIVSPQDTLRRPHHRGLPTPKVLVRSQTMGRDTPVARPGAVRVDDLSSSPPKSSGQSSPSFFANRQTRVKRADSVISSYVASSGSSLKVSTDLRRTQSEEPGVALDARPRHFKAAAHAVLVGAGLTVARPRQPMRPDVKTITTADVEMLKWEHEERLELKAARNRRASRSQSEEPRVELEMRTVHFKAAAHALIGLIALPKLSTRRDSLTINRDDLTINDLVINTSPEFLESHSPERSRSSDVRQEEFDFLNILSISRAPSTGDSTSCTRQLSHSTADFHAATLRGAPALSLNARSAEGGTTSFAPRPGTVEAAGSQAKAGDKTHLVHGKSPEKLQELFGEGRAKKSSTAVGSFYRMKRERKQGGKG